MPSTMEFPTTACWQPDNIKGAAPRAMETRHRSLRLCASLVNGALFGAFAARQDKDHGGRKGRHF